MTKVLVILALVVGIAGVLMSAQASMGAAIVGVGCILGILARIRQAAEQHAEMAVFLKQWKDGQSQG